MAKMIGIKYVGARPHGVSVIMYRSYKKFTVAPNKPYEFTKYDDISYEARNYYRRIARSLKLEVLVEGQEDELAVLHKKNHRRVHPAPTSVEVHHTYTAEVHNDAPVHHEEDAESHTAEHTEQPAVTIKSNLIEALGEHKVAELNDSEIAEFVDNHTDDQSVKDMISEMGIDYKPGRKSKGSIVADLIGSYRNELVAYLTK